MIVSKWWRQYLIDVNMIVNILQNDYPMNDEYVTEAKWRHPQCER